MTFSARELFDLIATEADFVLLDVRNEVDFGRFSIEGPNPFTTLNIPYFDFIEEPEASTAKITNDKAIRIVCAKEGSSEFVATVLSSFGRDDVAFLKGGINTWGNLLVPRRINDPSDAYEVWQFNRPAKASCGYGVVCNGEMMVFDPSRATDVLVQFASSRQAKITHIFETHLQADYISGAADLQRKTGAKIVAHHGDFGDSSLDTYALEDGEIFSFDSKGPAIVATHSPGHTPGSTTYVVDEKYLISGDTVFLVSVGRPDLGNRVVEWAKILYDTLRNRITPLPDALIVLPGHFTHWQTEADAQHRIMKDFGTVRALNEAIYGIEKESEFVDYMVENMRPQPKIYSKIRQVNAGLLHPSPEEMEIMDLGKNACSASLHNSSPTT